MPAAAASGRGDRDHRRKAIITVARAIFLQQGYAAASMSAIAARAGGSKGTLYNYFPSKERLFAALVQSECEAEALSDTALSSTADDVQTGLREIGLRFLGLVLGHQALNIHRLVIAESRRFPELGRAFYENGPKQYIAAVDRWIQCQQRAGRLISVDPERAATQFLELCKSGLHQHMLWNVDLHPSQEAQAANVEAAVAVFLAAYGEAGSGLTGAASARPTPSPTSPVARSSSNL